jgi:formate-nitrite transporter family protein
LAVIAGRLSAGSYLHWLLLATLGNIVGGVVMVSLLNYGQVREA